MDDDDVALLQRLGRHLDLDAVTVQPGIAGLLAEGVEQHLLGVLPRLLHQGPAEAQAPAAHRAREDRHGPEAADDDDRIEGIHSETILFQEDPPWPP